MIDLAIVALGFGLLPLLAVVLYAIPETLKRHEMAVWGLLVGVVAFLGLAHAGAALLEGNAFLRFEASREVSAGVAVGGLLAGIGLGWLVLGKRSADGDLSPSTIVWAAVTFVVLHSFADGLVLGEGYAGVSATGFPLTTAVVGGTVLHRFAEGSLILVPALLAAWRPPKAVPGLLAGLATLPAAYVPFVLLGPAAVSAASIAAEQALVVFAAGLEAGFALLFLLLGLLPRVRAAADGRWALWAGIAFTLMLLIHILVE